MLPARPRILVLGGTSETGSIIQALSDSGYAIIVSMATDVPLDLPQRPEIERRHGRLDAAAMGRLMLDKGVCVLVDATHPFAQQAHEQATEACSNFGIPCVRFQRGISTIDDAPHVLRAPNHEKAAAMAVQIHQPILLTVGSRWLGPYVQAARQACLPLVARVLNHPESDLACARAGLEPQEILRDRGPFTIEANRATIQRYRIGVLVTKDSGDAGGLPAKLEAARLEACKVVIVQRPATQGPSYDCIENLVHAVNRHANASGGRAPSP